MDPWSIKKYKLQNFQEKENLNKYFHNTKNNFTNNYKSSKKI